ncbi:MAG: DNA strand exchange inhibitor protein [Zavarzinella sp.]
MDSHTLGLIGFNKLLDIVSGYAVTSIGVDLVQQLEPMQNLEKVRHEIGLVTEMVDVLTQGQAPPLQGIRDVRLLLKRAMIGTMLTEEQLLQVSDIFLATGAFYRYRMRIDARHHRLLELLAPIEDMGTLAKNITSSIDGRGNVLDGASPELAEIRQKLFQVDEKVQQELKRLLRDPKLREVLRFQNATVNGDHYVLAVAANHRQKVPGVVHRTSSTGETIYIEPASISRFSAERVVLKGEEDREIKRILRKLSAHVGKYARPAGAALDIMARTDLITAKARHALDYKMYPPEMNTEGRLWLRVARHPLLEHLFRHETIPPKADGSPGTQRKVVPIDIRLGNGFDLLIITGPNTGGKTVTLKTTGLLSVMAMCGMMIPAAEGSCVPIFDHIFADIGDEQSIEQSLSTFSSHISRMSTIFAQATSRSLIMLDEVGAGTDPHEGAALGRAILDFLAELGCRAIVTTHLGDLKTYAFTNDRAENAAVEFDLETLRPTYRLHIGQFGMSNALKIARRLKLPKSILKRAHHYTRRKKGKLPEMQRLQALREDAEKARAEALARQAEADRQKQEYQAQLNELQRQARREEEVKRWRQTLQAGSTVYSARFRNTAKVSRVDHRKGIVVISIGIGQWETTMDDVYPEAPAS